MKVESLTYEAVRVRAVSVPLRRKVISRVGFFDRWPLILIDLHAYFSDRGRPFQSDRGR
jgi:mandelate racemase